MTSERPKHAIVTLCVGDAFQRLGQISHPLLRAYAAKVGAAFEVIDETAGERDPHFAKSALSSLLSHYERIAYIDTDVLVAPDCPNLFSAVPEDRFGAFQEGDLYDRTYSIRIVQDALGDIGWCSGYFNSGVMVASRQHKKVFETSFGSFLDPYFYEQTLYNYNAKRLGILLEPLKMSFNFFAAQGGNDQVRLSPFRFGMHMMHYAGPPKMRGLREEFMKNDVVTIRCLEGKQVRRLMLRTIGILMHQITPLMQKRICQVLNGLKRRMRILNTVL